jgi:hypothetical protein
LAGAKALWLHLRRLRWIYSVVKDLRRGERQDKVTSRGRRSIECREATDQEVCRTYIIQEAKKGVGALMIIFMEIQPVTEFGGEL